MSTAVCSPWACSLAGGSATPQNLASRTSRPPILPVNLAGSRFCAWAQDRPEGPQAVPDMR
jgi:hypothetical protein